MKKISLMSLAGLSAMFGMATAAVAQAANSYVMPITLGNGNGTSSTNRRAPGANGAFKRAAKKARNVAKHRKACRA